MMTKLLANELEIIQIILSIKYDDYNSLHKVIATQIFYNLVGKDDRFMNGVLDYQYIGFKHKYPLRELQESGLIPPM